MTYDEYGYPVESGTLNYDQYGYPKQEKAGGYDSFGYPVATKPKGGGAPKFDQYGYPVTAGAKRKKAPEDLDARLTALEQSAQEFGAREPDADKPGAFMTILDLLSRPNYAVAGIAEELTDGTPSIGDAAKRALSEVFSGVGGIQGEKRAFGEVLEKRGVGTKTLADALPFLDDTWVGNFGTRGALGIALDFGLDPITYMSLGGSGIAKIVTKGGKKGWVKNGSKLWIDTVDELRDKVFKKDFSHLADDVSDLDSVARGFLETRVKADATDLLGKQIDDGVLKASDIFEEGGLKFRAPFSKKYMKIPGSDKMGDAGMAVAKMLPFDAATRIGAASEKMYQGIRGAANSLFSSDGVLAELPDYYRQFASDINKQYYRSSFAHRSGLTDRMQSWAKVYRKLAKKDAEIGKRWYRAREGGSGSSAAMDIIKDNKEELAAFKAMGKMYDELGDSLVKHGVLDPGQKIPNYMHHHYKNLREFLETADNAVAAKGGASSSITKGRVFPTQEIAERETRELNEMALESLAEGDLQKLYGGALEADYDVAKNMERYINKHADVLSRKAWQEEMYMRFAKSGDDLFNTKLRKEIAFAQRRGDWLKDSIEKGGEKVAKLTKEAEILNAKASDLTASEAARLKQIKSKVGGIEKRRKELMDELAEMHAQGRFDSVKGVKPGDIEEQLVKVFGEDGARYVPVKNGFTNGKQVYIPKAIRKVLNESNSSMLNLSNNTEVGKFVKMWDRANNLFKYGVYTIFPASVTRDAYSNVALNGLRIGLAALNPFKAAEAVTILASKNADDLAKVVKGTNYTRGQIKDLMRSLGVTLDSSAFIDEAGQSITKGRSAFGRASKSLADKRAYVDNGSRVHLFIEELRRGADPRSAADTVGEFLINYGELSDFERNVVKRFIPFYTFTRKNVVIQAKALAKTPGRSVNQLKPFRQRHEESEQMVKWEGEALSLRLDRDGKTVTSLTGIDLPQRNLDTLWRGSTASTVRGVVGMVSPLAKVWIENAMGRDSFTGRDLTRTYSNSIGRVLDTKAVPKSFKDWLGFKKSPMDDGGRVAYSFDGERFNLLFKSWMFSRVISTSDRQFREYEKDPSLARAMLDLASGIRYKKIDLDEQQERRLKERIRSLERSLIQRGAGAEYSRFYQRDNAKEGATFR